MPESQEFLDFQIQFRTASTPSDGVRSTHEVRATIDGGGGWRGESILDVAQLAEAEADPTAYGRLLGQWLLPPQVAAALAKARGVTDRPVRIRLLLETGPDGQREEQHLLRWERAILSLNGQTWPIAITPTLPFSRYIATESIDPDLSDDTTMRVLVVFSNPTGLPAELRPVDIEADLAKLLDGLAPLVRSKRFTLSVLPGHTGLSDTLRNRLAELNADIVDGAARKELIGEALNGCQGLHIVAHGTFNAQTRRGALLLEDGDGSRVFAFDDELHSWVHPGLRFVLLQSCQGGATAPLGGPPLVGIGPTLVRLGVPAVVAMQDFVPMDDARVFAAAFYRSLMRSGIVDAAVNAGRQAISDKKHDDSYSIPVLFMRLRNGLLWRPDPVRNAVRARVEELERQAAPELPMRAVLSLHRNLEYELEAGPPGALFDMPAKLAELTQPPEARVLLVGPRGMAKGAQLRWLYRRAGRDYLDTEAAAPVPVLLTSRDILDADSVPSAIERSLAKDAGNQRRIDWQDRPLLLIVDGDEDLGEDKLAEVLARLKEFLRATPQRLAFSLDERARSTWDADIEPTAILVARPMAFERVLQFLKQLGTPAAERLREVVELRQCRDIAGAPWLLERMISLSQRKVEFDSRATLLGKIANECLASTPTAGIPRQCAERALEQMAWRIQWNREPTLGGSDLFDILARARGNREFRLAELLELLVRSGVLAIAGEDAVRFRYQSLQAYYAAQHLCRVPAPERRRLLEDITASLGRLSRARWWEKTLITLTGLQAHDRDQILSAILAGSTLIEGEQVYIAARCYTDTRDPKKLRAGVVDQIADALIWRSHPGNLRPYADRRRAALALAELRHPNAVPHFVSLATDQLASGWGGGKRYEFSGIRLIATNGLVLMRTDANEYVRTHRPQLGFVIDAWWKAYENADIEPLIAQLQKNDAATSPIAAFALGVFDSPAARAQLLAAFANEQMNGDVGWAVADTLAALDPAWVAAQVLAPRLEQYSDPRVAYLVGRTGMAGEYARHFAYLKECLRSGTPAVQARALRALGDLKDGTIRELCEAIVLEDWSAAGRLGLALPAAPQDEDAMRFRNVALEALRNVGTRHSIDILREARRGPGMSMTLRQLSFDVAEDIYWQITGGLSKESFDPSADTTRT